MHTVRGTELSILAYCERHADTRSNESLSARWFSGLIGKGVENAVSRTGPGVTMGVYSRSLLICKREAPSSAIAQYRTSDISHAGWQVVSSVLGTEQLCGTPRHNMRAAGGYFVTISARTGWPIGLGSYRQPWRDPGRHRRRPPGRPNRAPALVRSGNREFPSSG